VGDFDGALAELERRGADIERRFGIPHGPCATLRTPGVDRLAVSELSRPDADRHLRGADRLRGPIKRARGGPPVRTATRCREWPRGDTRLARLEIGDPRSAARPGSRPAGPRAR
jgi:hypothetical protein